MMAAEPTQASWTERMRSLSNAIDARLERALQPVDAATLAASPSGGGWSVGQVLEHLIVAEDSYFELLGRKLDEVASQHPDAIDAAAAPRTRWGPTLGGKFLIGGLRGKFRLPAPKVYRPGPAARADVVAAYAERRRAYPRLLDRTAPFLWRRVRFTSPVSSLLRLDVGDALGIIAFHADRHLAQIERVLREVREPRSRR